MRNCHPSQECISRTVLVPLGFDGVKRVAGCYQRGAFPEYEVMLMNMCIGTEPYKTCVCNTDNCNDGVRLLLLDNGFG